jgi:hypothetical protein
MSAPYIDTVQVLLLHVRFFSHTNIFSDLLQALYLAYRGKHGIAWVFSGLAVRHAQSIGLHRRSPRDLDLATDQVRLRSHLWWIAFVLDASVTLWCET